MLWLCKATRSPIQNAGIVSHPWIGQWYISEDSITSNPLEVLMALIVMGCRLLTRQTYGDGIRKEKFFVWNVCRILRARRKARSPDSYAEASRLRSDGCHLHRVSPRRCASPPGLVCAMPKYTTPYQQRSTRPRRCRPWSRRGGCVASSKANRVDKMRSTPLCDMP